MKVLSNCPCCSNPLLHHFGNHREYWFCRHCWQEMPDLKTSPEKRYQKLSKILNLSTGYLSNYQLTAVSK